MNGYAGLTVRRGISIANGEIVQRIVGPVRPQVKLAATFTVARVGRVLRLCPLARLLH